MNLSSPWILLWTLLIFASIAWYGLLLFIVGWKGGKEIIELARNLSRPHQPPRDTPGD